MAAFSGHSSRMMLGAAEQTLSAAPPLSLTEAEIAALAESPEVCKWCFNPLRRGRRAFVEVEALRRVLAVEMTTPFDPPICDGCYAGVMASAATPATLRSTPSSRMQDLSR